jgi:hypothetical protein
MKERLHIESMILNILCKHLEISGGMCMSDLDRDRVLQKHRVPVEMQAATAPEISVAECLMAFCEPAHGDWIVC